jgi:hypothetical protein
VLGTGRSAGAEAGTGHWFGVWRACAITRALIE